MNRRSFISLSAATTLAAIISPTISACKATPLPIFKISLAQWSVQPLIFGDVIEKMGWSEFLRLLHTDYETLLKTSKLSTLDFPEYAKSLGFDAVEYVNTFFFNKANDPRYLSELKTRSLDAGVKNLIIMCDEEGALGDKDNKLRKQAVENHYKWIDAAAFLGCHSIRVNAQTNGSNDEAHDLVADGMSQLCDYSAKANINVLIENHGGLSSNIPWLVDVVKAVNHSRLGLLPDFGNFTINYETGEVYDRYLGIEQMMPYAKAVSAKSNAFDKNGNETKIDYLKAMKLVLDAGYRGYVGVEYEGYGLNSEQGILATKSLLEKVRDQLTPDYT